MVNPLLFSFRKVTMKSYIIHPFHHNGRYFLLDTESGAVHVVEEVIYHMVPFFEEGDREKAWEALKNRYDEALLNEAWDELEALKEAGLLMAPKETQDFVYNPENIIKAMCLHVAHDCNLRCTYCFASQGDFQGTRELMDLETGKKALRFLAENSGNRHHLEVDFFGGEPLMNWDVVKELVHYGRSIEGEYGKKFRFTVTTNGLLLDDEKNDFINEHMDNVVLSLDGRREVNDAMRPTVSGEGSFDLIVPKFQKLVGLRGDKDYYIRGTFTSQNLDFAEDVKLYRELGFQKTSMEPVVTDPQEPYALLEDHLPAILKEYETLTTWMEELHDKGERDFLFFHFMLDLDQGPCIVKRSVGCGAGSEYVAVTPAGDLYPCHQFVGEKEFKLGTLDTGIVHTEIRDRFKEANISSKEACGSCWAKYYCSGGCHANAYYSHGDILKPYELGCEMEKKRLECAIYLKSCE